MNTQYFERTEGKIAYDDNGGEGELVIMLPGMGALRSEYRFLAPALQEAGYHVVTADLRGYGESSAFWPEYTLASAGKDLLGLINHLDAGPAHVIGTSFSPGAAVYAAAEQPEAIRSLVLIGAFVRDPQPSKLQNLMTAALLSGPWKRAGWAMYYKTLFPTQKPDDFDEYMAQLKKSLSEPGRFDALKELGFATKKASEARLSGVKAPTLVIIGTKDPDWPDPVAEAKWITDKLSAEMVLIDGAGHYPQTEMPDKTIPHITEFLAQVQANGN